MANPITDKQSYAIKVIEEFLGITFHGSTKQDAFLWLREYVPKAKEEAVRQIAPDCIPLKSQSYERLDYLNKDIKDLPNASDSANGDLLIEMNIQTCKSILGV